MAANAASQNLASANVLTNGIKNLFTSSNRYVRGSAYFVAFVVVGAFLYFAYKYLAGGGEEQQQGGGSKFISGNSGTNNEEAGNSNKINNTTNEKIYIYEDEK